MHVNRAHLGWAKSLSCVASILCLGRRQSCGLVRISRVVQSTSSWPLIMRSSLHRSLQGTCLRYQRTLSPFFTSAPDCSSYCCNCSVSTQAGTHNKSAELYFHLCKMLFVRFHVAMSENFTPFWEPDWHTPLPDASEILEAAFQLYPHSNNELLDLHEIWPSYQVCQLVLLSHASFTRLISVEGMAALITPLSWNTLRQLNPGASSVPFPVHWCWNALSLLQWWHTSWYQLHHAVHSVPEWDEHTNANAGCCRTLKNVRMMAPVPMSCHLAARGAHHSSRFDYSSRLVRCVQEVVRLVNCVHSG